VGAEFHTPFVALRGLVTVEGRTVDGRTHLALPAVSDPGPRVDDVRGGSSPEWGLHVIDVNVVMGDLVAVATRQAASYSSG
jgi:hypothetical protein